MARAGRVTLFARRLLPTLAVVVLLAAALLLANDAAGGSSRLAAWYPWLLAASAGALAQGRGCRFPGLEWGMARSGVSQMGHHRRAYIHPRADCDSAGR